MADLLKPCLDQNYFVFNDQYCIQTNTLPLSQLLADIFIVDLENYIINDTYYASNVVTCGLDT